MAISANGAKPTVQLTRSAINAVSYIAGHDKEIFDVSPRWLLKVLIGMLPLHRSVD